MTEHYVTDQCGEDNAEHWRELYAAVNDDLTRLRDIHSRQSSEIAQRERDREATVKREVWDAVTGFQRWVSVQTARQPFGALIYVAEHLADKPRIDDVRALRSVALAARQALEQAAERPVAVLDELKRLRRAVRLAGEFLHDKAGDDSGARCACLGCDLARMAEEDPT